MPHLPRITRDPNVMCGKPCIRGMRMTVAAIVRMVAAGRETEEILRDYPNDIQVEGFTDDVPINTVAYPSNWELSAARAGAVVRLLVEEGSVPADRLAAVGYAETRPLAPNDSPEERGQNRRVEFLLTRPAPSPSPPAAPAPEPEPGAARPLPQ